MPLLLRLRKEDTKSDIKVATVAFTSNGSHKMNARLPRRCEAGREDVSWLRWWAGAYADVAEALSAASSSWASAPLRVPGLLCSVVALAERAGARTRGSRARAATRHRRGWPLPGLRLRPRHRQAGAQSLGWGELPERASTPSR